MLKNTQKYVKKKLFYRSGSKIIFSLMNCAGRGVEELEGCHLSYLSEWTKIYRTVIYKLYIYIANEGETPTLVIFQNFDISFGVRFGLLFASK